MAKIYKTGRGHIKYEISNEYLGLKEDGKNTGTKSVDFNSFKIQFDDILVRIEKFVNRYNKKEKVCQQWLANTNNLSNSSDWYFLDVEYVEGNGRYDMIAISKEAHGGKYDVVLIELKVGTGAYTTAFTNMYKENKNEYDSVMTGKEVLYNKMKLSYGSGIVGHICDYLRYLSTNDYESTLKQEIINMLEFHNECGILSSENLAKVNKSMLADKPEIYFVTYSNMKEFSSKKIKNLESKTELRTQMKKYLYKGTGMSKFSLEKMVYCDDIDGFLKEQSQFDEDKEFITVIQNIKGKDFRFNFVFKDQHNIDIFVK